jgi:hypothetical protein
LIEAIAAWGHVPLSSRVPPRSEQRLKQVVIRAIDQNDASRSISEKSSRYFS